MKGKYLILGLAVLMLCMAMPAFAGDPSAIVTGASMLGTAAAAAGGIVTREIGRKNAGLPDISPELKQALEQIKNQVGEFVTKNQSAIEDGGRLAKSAKDVADQLLLKQGEILSRLQEVEQKQVRNDDGGAAEVDSIGPALKEAEEQIKDFINVRGMRKQVNIPISRKALLNTGTTGTALNYPGQQLLPTPLQPLLRRLTIRDLLMPGRISGSVAFYQRESGFTNNAAPVSEGSLKPTSELTFELITEPVRTIAHLFDISLQMLSDLPYIESYIRSRMVYGLKLKEEAQLLTGAGTGQNLEGIYTAATAYSAPSGAIIAGTADETDIDKLRLAILQAELAEASVTGIVLHPTDWANIELLKDGESRYLFASPQAITTPRLWGRDVVPTQAMTQTKFLVGDFAMHAQILDREDANVAISFENNDNFSRNMATIRVEERVALAIYRPEAFIKGTLESGS